MSARARPPKNPVEPSEDDLPGGSTIFWSTKNLMEWRELVEYVTQSLSCGSKKMVVATKSKVKARPPKNRPEEEDDEQPVPEKRKLKLRRGGKPAKRKQVDVSDDYTRTKNVVTVQPRKGLTQRLSQFASATMRTVMGELRTRFTHEHVAGAGAIRNMCCGIPIPFVLEWLLQSNVLPLGRVIQIVGKTGSCKSSLAVEFIRLIRTLDGVGYLFENESKFNAELALSILGYPHDAGEEVLCHVPCQSCDDWQNKLQLVRDNLVSVMCRKSKLNKNPLGCLYPVGMIIDSVMGKLSMESNDKIRLAGHADRKHPDEAMKITYFLKKFAGDIDVYPFLLILVNHLKIKKIEGTSATERIKTGGALIDFQESVELECKKISDIKRVNQDKKAAVDAGGNRLLIKCAKNSFGQTNRELHVDMLWEDRIMTNGEVRQFSRFDWSGAAVDMLLEYQTVRRGAIRDIVDIQLIGDKQRYYSNKLGVSKKDPVTKTEMGKLITSDKDIRRELRKMLGIKRYTIFKPGVDFKKLQLELRKKYEAEVDRV